LHLKSLTLRGFKSFASATTLELEPCITCVVGPNGSGKSNVVDALAWVMGEQGAKSLRGATMEDVVFAGTSDRPALGRAEVVLTIDNSDGALPIEYTEVTIARTLFRNGGSEYAINGQSCRLLDVQELLGDSGIGREMHVVVGQGQLDAGLAARPEDRRGFLEEAAGVLKHRKRKEKALRKLDATDGNLTRLNDLLGEIRRQLKPLGRQAELARRAAVVQAEARDARARLLADDITTARESLRQELADEQALRDRRAEVERALAEARSRDSDLEEAVRSVARRLAGAQETWYRLGGLRDRIGGVAALAAERMRLSLDAPDEGSTGPDPAQLEGEALRARAAEQQVAADVAERSGVLAAAVAARRAAERSAAEEDRRVAELARARSDRREGLVRLRGEVGTARARVRAAEEELERLSAVRTEALERATRAQHDFTALETRVAGLDAGEVGLDAEHEAARLALADADDRLTKHREEAQRADRERVALAARKEALELALTRPGGAGALIGGVSGVTGVLGSVAELLEVRPGYETAVAAALGTAADAVAMADVDAALDAVAYLRRDDLGRASMLVAGAPPGDGTLPALPDGTTRLLDVVSAPAALRNALHRILAGVAVVDDVHAGRELVNAMPHVVAVTRDGVVLSSGFVAGGSSSAPTLVELKAAYEGTVEAFDSAVGATERTRFALNRIEDERADAQRRVDVALARLHESDAALAAVAERLAQLGAAARAAREEADRAQSAIEAAQAALAGHRRGLAQLEQRLTQAEQLPQAEVDDALRDRLVAAASAARQSEVDARLALRTAEERANALSGRADSLLARAAAERDSRSRAEQRRAQQRRERDVAQAVGTAATVALAHLEESLASALELRRRLESERNDAEARASQVRSRLRELADDLDRLTNSVHRDEVARAEQRLRIEQLEQRSVDELGLDVDALLADYGPTVAVPAVRSENDGGGAPASVPYVRAAQVERLRTAEQALTLLGRINPLALEEFDALEERHAFLSQQLDDLRRTRSDLLQIVRDVDAHMEEIFAAAWRDTAREFTTVFARLFPGGEGRLVLTDPDDMLTTGIEVEARPAGKKLKRLSLLSGGERSLVAVAFLVALFKARPSPFYILDEVEAALDDTNLRRLLGIYEELRSTSQLVVVTHQKRTMEIADALYGVSMRDDGVSTVISQRLRELQPAWSR